MCTGRNIHNPRIGSTFREDRMNVSGGSDERLLSIGWTSRRERFMRVWWTFLEDRMNISRQSDEGLGKIWWIWWTYRRIKLTSLKDRGEISGENRRNNLSEDQANVSLVNGVDHDEVLVGPPGCSGERFVRMEWTIVKYWVDHEGDQANVSLEWSGPSWSIGWTTRVIRRTFR